MMMLYKLNDFSALMLRCVTGGHPACKYFYFRTPFGYM